jgi:hypothetical protein
MHVAAEEAPSVIECLPAPQFVHVLAADAPVLMRYLPAAQLVQVLAKAAPVAAEYLPAAQPVHAAEPMSVLYVPATHAEQEPPSDPVYPLLQRQSRAAALPLGELESAGHVAQVEAKAATTAAENALAAQSVHAAEPEPALYFPATHSAQVCPSGPVAPALQVQAARRADPGGEFEFAGQTSQVGLPSGDHPPSEHCRHVSTPVAPSAAE